MHAMIITAYNDFDLLLILLKYYSYYCDCYVHIDKKSSIPSYVSDELKKIKNVYFIQKYKINWGSYKHILAVLDLMNMAKDKKSYSHYHILSANTFPLRSFNEIDIFFKNNKANYIEMIDVSTKQHYAERQKYFYFSHLYDLKTSNGREMERKIINIQRRLRINRSVSLSKKGYFYCHLTNEFVEYIYDYLKTNHKYLNNLRTCYIPEEFFFQNIINNSPYRDTIINSHLIYDDWSKGEASPAKLGIKDFDNALETNNLFIRKICDVDTIYHGEDK